MTIENAKQIVKEHNEHIQTMNDTSEWFGTMVNALNGKEE